MARRRESSNFHRIVFSFFGVAFLLIAIAVGYKIISEGSVLGVVSDTSRSGINWEFNGKNRKNTEGWTGNQLTTLEVIGGYLHAVKNPSRGTGNVKRANINKQLVGKSKYFRVRMSVTIPTTPRPQPAQTVVKPVVVTDPTNTFQSSVGATKTPSSGSTNSSLPCRYVRDLLPGEWCPTPTPKPQGQRYSFLVTYTLANNKKTVSNRTLQLSGYADGQMYEQSILLAETETVTIKDLKISFDGLLPNGVVNFDWIRLTGEQVKPPPCQPRPICLDTPGSLCYPQEPQGGWCPTTPSPTPGCFYQQVECFKAPCEPILVCPTQTPTPKPSCQPRPICLDTAGSRCYPQEPPGGWCPTTPYPTNPTPNPSDCCSVEKQHQGYKCVQDCGPPVVRSDYQEQTTYTCLSPNDADARSKYGCPICLASNTMIATPNGDMSVTALVPGMIVWTQNKDGERVAVPIVSVSRTPVAPTHQVIHLELSDGREVWASPNHPTKDGTVVRDLQPGFSYDGASITVAASVPYWDLATYDLLPAGDTGFYWANGIPMGSTLK